jgi:hypothetical protein
MRQGRCPYDSLLARLTNSSLTYPLAGKYRIPHQSKSCTDHDPRPVDRMSLPEGQNRHDSHKRLPRGPAGNHLRRVDQHRLINGPEGAEAKQEEAADLASRAICPAQYHSRSGPRCQKTKVSIHGNSCAFSIPLMPPRQRLHYTSFIGKKTKLLLWSCVFS